MQEVPVVFFQRDFDFAHPDTFAAVCGATDVPPALARPRALLLRRSRLPAHPCFPPPCSRWCCRSA